MQYTLSTSEALFEQLADAVFSEPGREGAAYLLCGVSTTDGETRLLARDVVPVRDEHYLTREANRLSILSDSYAHVAKRAKISSEAVLFVHSHPSDFRDFSRQDDIEEPKLLSFFHGRAPGLPHGSLVFSSRREFHARVRIADAWHQLSRIRIFGKRFRFVDKSPGEEPIPEFFDRQVRAFGPDVQRLLRRLHVGVVGAGGTGSATIEQLTRLGVGALSIFDGETLIDSNVTRVYGSRMEDQGKSKAEIQQTQIIQIGLGTRVIVYPKPITDEATAKHLRECDVLFGCTDKHAPRGILVRIALRYRIPVLDMAVKIDAPDGNLRGIWGRVTTLLPGEACLFCRGTIDPEIIRAEGLPPEQRDREIAEGYIRGLATDEPAVVMFTTGVAAQAVSELLHRLTGFMGADRLSSEVLMFFHEGRVRTNRQAPNSACLCQLNDNLGRGDSRNFLGVVW